MTTLTMPPNSTVADMHPDEWVALWPLVDPEPITGEQGVPPADMMEVVRRHGCVESPRGDDTRGSRTGLDTLAALLDACQTYRAVEAEGTEVPGEVWFHLEEALAPYGWQRRDVPPVVLERLSPR